MRHGFKIGETDYDIGLSRAHHGYRLHIDEREVPIDITTGEQGNWQLRCGETMTPAAIAVAGDDIYIHLDGSTYHLRYLHPLDRLSASAGGAAEDQILAPMPGTVISVAVEAGAEVATGATLMVIESMKMETTLAAPRDGVVAELHAGVGETFDRDALLISMQPEDAQ